MNHCRRILDFRVWTPVDHAPPTPKSVFPQRALKEEEEEEEEKKMPRHFSASHSVVSLPSGAHPVALFHLPLNQRAAGSQHCEGPATESRNSSILGSIKGCITVASQAVRCQLAPSASRSPTCALGILLVERARANFKRLAKPGKFIASWFSGAATSKPCFVRVHAWFLS